VVKQQADIGIDIVSDGEFGKSISWARYVLERLGGFEQRDRKPREQVMAEAPKRADILGRDRVDFADFYAEYDKSQGFTDLRGWHVTGPITYTGQKHIQRDIDNFKAALKGRDVTDAFMPAVAPASVAPERKDEHYKSEEEALFAIADALNVEYKAIVDAGFILQVDDAHLPMAYERMEFDAYRKWAAVRMDALNQALKGLPDDRTRCHICWGSWNGPHTADVPLKDIVDLVLRVKTGGYSIEMANPRHEHEWRVWESVKLPGGKTLIPGVISHATNVVEHPELVAQRLVRLAKLVGRENVIGSTDCGFAQGPFVRRVHPSIQWAKLKALADGAALATKELWGRRSAA
jgi:5-methyltetrahydropteroyltriglutamate--homocysteine methyltransferase